MAAHRLYYPALFVFILFLLKSELKCQDAADTNYYSPKFFKNNTLSIGMDKQLDTYLFSNFLKYGFTGNDFFIGAREIFNSTIINSSVKNIKDEHNLFFTGGYNLLSNLTAGLALNNIIFADDRVTQINKTSLFNSYFYLHYKPLANISIIPYAGFSENRQNDQTDEGAIYGSDISVNSLMLSDFELNSQLKFQNEDISPRKNTLRSFTVNLTNNFEDSFTNIVTGSFFQQRKDFYFTADAATALEYNIANNIQSRTETYYMLQDKFKSVPFTSGFGIEAVGSVYWRTIDRDTRYAPDVITNSYSYDTQINELKIDLTGGIEYKSPSFTAAFRFTYNQYEEKHDAKKIEGVDYLIYDNWHETEYSKNNQAETETVSLSAAWNISDNDLLTFSIFHRKLKYDTPSTNNYDDRDELLSIGHIGYEKKISSSFKIDFGLDGCLNKIVYIYSEKSANNNIKRFIRFLSSGFFTVKNFSSLNSAEVSANYTTYDFDYLIPTLQSYSFRQFIYRDSSSYSFTGHLKLLFNGYIKLSEQGSFAWSSFSERPERYLDERLFEPKIGYFVSNLMFSFGFRYFDLSTYTINSTNDKIRIGEYESIGPTSEIKYIINNKADLRFLGWYEFVTGNGLKREIPNIILKVTWAI